MRKASGSWSGMRKYLEKEMLAAKLQGRVRYNCTSYVGMDSSHIFEIYVDDMKVKSFSLETVNTYFINRSLTKNKTPFGIQEYWNEFWTTLHATPMNERTEYTDGEFSEALAEYKNQQIEDSILSNNPLVRMFAVFDRRVGKRTLEKLKETIDAQPAWLRQLYVIRLSAEQL